MKTKTLFLALLAAGAAAAASAQAPIPEPPVPNADQPILLRQESPLLSLEEQVKTAGFDQRGAFATAFDNANLAVDTQVAALRARGLTFAEEAETNLTVARDQGRQTFRDLSLTTSETWQSARENAVTAVRRIRSALADLENFAIQPQA